MGNRYVIRLLDRLFKDTLDCLEAKNDKEALGIVNGLVEKYRVLFIKRRVEDDKIILNIFI